jgi:hypothetical protein
MDKPYFTYKGKNYVKTTRNKSFLETGAELKALGIKNWYFMLLIYDTSLIGVDPYAKNLSQDQMARIIYESSRNMWYFCREIARIPLSSSESVPLYMHRAAAAQFWCLEHYIDSDLCIPRRNYKTTNMLAGPMQWVYNYKLENGRLALYHYDASMCKSNLSMFKGFLEVLPPYMQYKPQITPDEFGKKRKEKAIDQATSISHPRNKTVIVTKAKATSEASAMKMARGSKHDGEMYDEAEWTERLITILGSSSAAYAEQKIKAKATGGVAFRVFTSTPGSLDDSTHKENYERFIKLMPKWTESMYDMTEEERDYYMEHAGEANADGTRINVVYIEYDYMQCRRDNKWLDQMIKETIGGMKVVRREYLLQRIRGNNSSPFDPSLIEYLIQNIKKPIGDKMVLNNKYRFVVYNHTNYSLGINFDPSVFYFIGVDPAYGVGGDNTAITIINMDNLQVAAEFKSAYIGSMDLCDLLVDLGMNYINKCLFCIEARASGTTMWDYLKKTPIANNIYSSLNKDDYIKAATEENSGVTTAMVNEARERKLFGVPTSRVSRRAMQEITITHMLNYKETMLSGYLVDDICHLVEIKSRSTTGVKLGENEAKFGASNGEHDDCWMSWCIAMYVYYYGQSLERYGFYQEIHPLDSRNPERHYEQLEENNPASPSAENDDYMKAAYDALRESILYQNVGMLQESNSAVTVSSTDSQQYDDNASFLDYMDWDTEPYNEEYSSII